MRKTYREKRELENKKNLKILLKKKQKYMEIAKRLSAEKLYKSTESDSLFSGHYEYNHVIWEVFEAVGINDPQYKTYDNHLAKKNINDLTSREIVEQFLFWMRGERFCEGTIAEAINSGNFINLYTKFLDLNCPHNEKFVD